MPAHHSTLPLFHSFLFLPSCIPHPRESYNFMNVPQPLSLVYAKGSCAELRSQLYVALDVEYIDGMTFQKLHDLARETSRLVGGLRAAVYRQKSKAE
jgi:hypothetical protein